MKVISPSRLVALLDEGLNGEVIFSGEVNILVNGTQVSESRGEFNLSRDRDGYLLLDSKEMLGGLTVYRSNFKIREGTSPRVSEGGGVVAIPVDYDSPQKDHPGTWMIIKPKEIKY